MLGVGSEASWTQLLVECRGRQHNCLVRFVDRRLPVFSVRAIEARALPSFHKLVPLLLNLLLTHLFGLDSLDGLDILVALLR